VAGVGLGMTFAPLQTIAMLNVEPRMAGAASGFINTTRQLGGVIGGAAVGALLQAQLSDKLKAAALANSANLPPAERAKFLSAVGNQSGKLDIGNTAGGVKFPPGTPPQVVELATKVFHQGFVNAMRVTLWLPIAALAVGAVAVLLARQRPKRAGQPEKADETAVPVGG
jgi:hypothetical protein